MIFTCGRKAEAGWHRDSISEGRRLARWLLEAADRLDTTSQLYLILLRAQSLSRLALRRLRKLLARVTN